MADERNTISIIVAGMTASGKSTIATKLQEVLTEAGFEVELHDEPGRTLTNIDERLANLASVGRKVHISVTQISREASK